MSIKKLSLPQPRSFIVTDQRLKVDCGILDQLSSTNKGVQACLLGLHPREMRPLKALFEQHAAWCELERFFSERFNLGKINIYHVPSTPMGEQVRPTMTSGPTTIPRRPMMSAASGLWADVTLLPISAVRKVAWGGKRLTNSIG